MINNSFFTQPLVSQSLGASLANLRQYFHLIGLVILLFISALTRVYISELHRQMMVEKSQLISQQESIHDHFDQLLEVESQLSNEASIAREAKQKLSMILPKHQQTVLV